MAFWIKRRRYCWLATTLVAFSASRHDRTRVLVGERKEMYLLQLLGDGVVGNALPLQARDDAEETVIVVAWSTREK